MNVNQIVRERIYTHLGQINANHDQLNHNIDAFIAAYGLDRLEGNFSDETILQIVDTVLSNYLRESPQDTAMLLSNWKLIDELETIDNKALSGKADPNELEAHFAETMSKIYQIQGLSDRLNWKVSEILLNLDHLRGNEARSERLHLREDNR